MNANYVEPLSWDALEVSSMDADPRTDVAMRNENTGPGWLRVSIIANRANRANRDGWIFEHRTDARLIPDLTDAELVQFRLWADIRADTRVLNLATAELWRRGIKDYPIAV